MPPNRDAARASLSPANAVLNQVGSRAGRCHLQAEAGYVRVPKKLVAVARFKGVNAALCNPAGGHFLALPCLLAG